MLLVTWLFMQFLQGHPHNVSSGTAQWIEETQSLEVALQVSVEDLEEILIKQLKRELTLDGKSAEKELKTYVESHVKAHHADKTTVKSKWIGYEVDDATAWIYIEFSFGKPTMKGCTLTNSILIDTFEHQTNLLNVTRGKKRKTLKFRKRQQECGLPSW